MLDQRAAENHVEQLLAATDAEYRHVALERSFSDRPLEIGPGGFDDNRWVACFGAEQGRVDIKSAAGDDKAGNQVEIVIHAVEFMRQHDR